MQSESSRKRQQFAEHIRKRIEHLNVLGRWDTRSFTDLEAEFYAGNRSNLSRWTRLRTPLSFGPRRVKALSLELIRHTRRKDQFALIEGDPGSGKTVLLRQVALELCSLAASGNTRAPIALYVNLKMLERAKDAPLDQSLIRRFVLDQLKRAKNPEIDRYLDEEFEKGIAAGHWLFLFDSFDEIPEVLSAEDVSETIDRYSNAIFDFATDFNRCRTLLATRRFRRPKDSSQAKYRVLPLSDKQRNQLVARAGLSTDATNRLYDGIGTAGAGFRYILENPMYLGLLVEHVRDGQHAPRNSHDLFASFVGRRLAAREEELFQQYHVDSRTLGEFAELVSFHIITTPRLGLNPNRSDLLEAVATLTPAWREGDRLLDALEFLGFGRGESELEEPGRRRFTFSHRRFQEYFATSYVLRVEGATSAEQLLFDPRWRETAVVLLRSSVGPKLETMFGLVRQVLDASVTALREHRVYVPPGEMTGDENHEPDFYPWPSNSLHVLSVIQEGFAEDSSRLPPDIRTLCADLVRSGFRRGRLEDRRVALEVAGSLRDEELAPLLRSAIDFGSRTLDDIAFQQMRELERVPDVLSTWIRMTLMRRAGRGELTRERRTLEAFLSRIRDGGRLVSAMTLLCRIWWIDAALLAAMVPIFLFVLDLRPETPVVLVTGAVASFFWRVACWRLFGYFPHSRERPIIQPATTRVGRLFQPKIPGSNQAAFAMLMLLPVGYVLLARWAPLVEFFGPTPTAERLMVVAWCVVAGWAPMATWAFAAGELTNLKWYPVLTFYPLVRWVLRPVSTFRVLGAHLKQFGVVYLAVALWFGFFGGGLYVAAASMPHAEPIFLGGMYAAVILVLLSWAAIWLLDWGRFFRFQGSQRELAPADFLAELSRYHLNSFRIRFIRLVSGNMMLRATEDGLQLTRHLNLALDRELTRHSQEPTRDTGMTTVDQWKQRYSSRRPNRLRGWGIHVLDELTRLEQRLTERLRAEHEVQRIRESPAEERTSMKDFFISYNQADLDWASWIGWTLEEKGYSVILQAWDFRPAENFVLKMDEALRTTQATIAVLSEHYLSATFTHPEWAAAFAADPSGTRRTLIPVRVRQCEPVGLLAQIIRTDLVGLSESAAEAALVAMLEERSKPGERPPYPGSGINERVVTQQAVFPGQSGARLGTADRLDLIRTLNALPTELFEVLVFTLRPPPGVIAPMPAPQGQRSSQLLKWVEGPAGSGLDALKVVLDEVVRN